MESRVFKWTDPVRRQHEGITTLDERHEMDEASHKGSFSNRPSVFTTLYGRRFQIVVLAVLWIFYVANLIVWESKNRQLLAFDEVGHFLASCVTSKILGAPWVISDLPKFLGGLPSGLGSWVIFNFSIFPPFVYVVTGLLYFLLPPSLPLAAASSNAIFLLILLIAVYGMADEMLGRMAGVVAAFLVSAYPLVVGLTRLYLLDFPLTAMVALSLFLLTKTRMFQNRKAVLLLSLSIILGMLTRHSFPLYVLGPILYVIVKSSRDRAARKNVILCVAMASLSALYYIAKPGGLGVYEWYSYYTRAAGLTFSTPPYVAVLIYLRAVAQGIGYPLFMLLSGGLLVFLKLHRKSRGFMLMGFLMPILLLGVVYPVWYDPRFVAPVLPLAAVASSCFFKKFNWRSWSQLATFLILGTFVMAQYASITYNVPFLSGIYTERALGASPPVAEDWKIPQILHTLEKDAMDQHYELPILVALSIDFRFDQTLFEYYAYVDGIRVIVPPNYGQYSTTDGINIVNSSDYVVTRSDSAQWAGAPIALVKNVVAVSDYVQSHITSFLLIANYSLPDGSVASLYRRIAPLAYPSVRPSSSQVPFWMSSLDEVSMAQSLIQCIEREFLATPVT